jgi:hypothetical protein
MILQEPSDANSHRFTRLAKKLRNKAYRASYMASHTKLFLANQINALRGDLSQQEFGEKLGKPQPVVSRLQNPNYGKYALQTLLDVAIKLDLALIVRFVDYPTFLRLTNDFSDNAVRPAAFSQEQVDQLAVDMLNGEASQAALVAAGNVQQGLEGYDAFTASQGAAAQAAKVAGQPRLELPLSTRTPSFYAEAPT